jgi:hypothetical protein
MMITCCSKHVEAWNKYIKKQCVKLGINQNYVKMHGQQNIKLYTLFWHKETFASNLIILHFAAVDCVQKFIKGSYEALVFIYTEQV